MFDSAIRQKIDPTLNKLAVKLGDIGIGPNQITLYGFVVGIVGCIAIGLQNYQFGLFLLLLNRLADGLDGAVARFQTEKGEKKSPFGAYLDIILDMILFGTFVLFFVLGQPHQASAGVFLMFSFIGLFATSLGSYMVTTDGDNTNRSFLHPTRLIEGTEIIIFMILVSLYPIAFSAISVLFGTLCWITSIARIWFTYWDLKKKD